MADLEQIIRWCQVAREILKTTGKKGGRAQEFQKALDKVSAGVTELNRLAGESTLAKGAYHRFTRIAEDANALSSYTGKDSRDKAKKITERLEALHEDIEKLTPQAKNLHKYHERMEQCRTRRADLDTYRYKDLTAVDNVINGAVISGEALNDPKLVKQALDILAGFDKAVKLSQEAQQKNAEIAQQHQKAMPKCLDRIRALREVLVQANNEGFGVHTEIKTLTEAITATERYTAKSEWAEAWKPIEKLDPKIWLKSVRETSKKTLEKLPPEAAQIQKKLAEYEKLVDGAAYTDAAKLVHQQLNDALYQLGNRETLLLGALSEMNARIEKAKKDRDQAVQQSNAIVNALAPAKAILTELEFQHLNSQLNLLRIDIEQRRLKQAANEGNKLLLEVNRVVGEAKTAQERWRTEEDAFTNLIGQLLDKAEDTAAPPDARAACKRLADAAVRVTDQLVSAREWDSLLLLYSRLQDEADTFETTKQAYAEFALLREEEQQMLDPEFHVTQKAFEAARKELAKQSMLDAEEVLRPLEQRLERIKKAWETQLANATSVETLGAQAVSEQLLQLRTDLANSISAEARFRAAFEKMVAGMAKMFSELGEFDTQQETLAQVKLAQLRADPELTWDKKREKLEEIAVEMRQARDTAREKQTQRKDEFQKKFENLEKRLSQERSKLKSTKDKTFASLFQDLGEELSDLKILAATPNANAGEAVEKRLADLDRRLRGIEARSEDGSAFAIVRQELDRLDETLEKASSLLKDNLPKALATLRESVTELKTSVLTLPPGEAIDELNAVKILVHRAQTEAKGVESLRTSFNSLQPVVQSKIELLAKKNAVPALVKVFEQRMKAAGAQAKKPDKLTLAKQLLDQLNHDIEDAFIKPEKGLEMQTKVLQEEERQRLLKSQCESELAQLKKAGVKRAREAVKKAGGDFALLDEIDRMLNDCAELVKGGDYAEGVRKLALVRRRIGEVEADPYGPGIGSRNALPEDANRFEKAAEKLLGELKVLPSKVNERMGGLKPPVSLPESLLTKLTSQVEKLTRQIDPKQFGRSALQLSDSKQPARDRRELREAALQTLRETRSLLSEQPQFAALWSNPFHVELKARKNELDQRLLALEANIRRSVH